MKPLAVLLPCLLALAASAAEVSFNREIRPLLSENCYFCHGTDANHRKGGRRLDTFAGATEERDGVRALVPGDPDRSELWRRLVTTDEDDVMPPPAAHKTPLTAAQQNLIRRWIEEGGRYEAHWAFVAPQRPAVPAGVSAIDHFVGRRLRAEGLDWAPAADAATQLRRVTLDLTGLPPTPAELAAFEREFAGDPERAYAAAVDRLLASPHYGEHQAMAWLDAARYADSNGYQMDSYRMNWPWRDWVVRAFNENLPFDVFTVEQLAGDRLPAPTTNQLVATAFNRNHMLNAEGGTIPEENRTKNVFDRVDTTGTVWLGLTVGCAQCHDHKFDPFTQRDYYGLYALFNQLSEPGGVDKRFGRKSYSNMYDSLYAVESPYLLLGTAAQQAALQSAGERRAQAERALLARHAEFRGPFTAWIEALRADAARLLAEVEEDGQRRIVNSLPLAGLDFTKISNKAERALVERFLSRDPRWAGAVEELEALRTAEEAAQMAIPHVMIMRDDKPRVTRLLKRGSYETPGDPAEPALPAFLPAPPPGTRMDRLALARWLVSPDQPLTARVVVNRFWQQFYGRGLVKTPDDFGLQGALPSHPELLDWLAVEFRTSGWDVKRLVRTLVTARAYRQTAAVSAAVRARDPDNELLARGPRQRLDSRVLRDQALALSGLLVDEPGGPPVMPYQPPGIWEEMSFGKNRYFQGQGRELYRRSLYTFWRRSVAPASFFDVPSRQVCAVKPQRTSTPLHALTTLNDVTYVEAARVWAQRLAERSDDDARLREAFRAATSHWPAAADLVTLRRALADARRHYAGAADAARRLVAAGESPRPAGLDPREHAAWTTVCLLLLNLDETLSR